MSDEEPPPAAPRPPSPPAAVTVRSTSSFFSRGKTKQKLSQVAGTSAPSATSAGSAASSDEERPPPASPTTALTTSAATPVSGSAAAATPAGGTRAVISSDEDGYQSPGPAPKPFGAEGGSAEPGQLVINVMRAHGLVAGEPYAKVYVKAGDMTHFRRTQVAKPQQYQPGAPSAHATGTHTEWEAHFAFDRVWAASTEVVVMLKNHRFGPGKNARLGQVAFRLEDLELPSGGGLVPRSLALGPVTEGGRRSEIAPQGTLQLEVGWMTEGIHEAEDRAVDEARALQKRRRAFSVRFVKGTSESGSGGSDEEGEIAAVDLAGGTCPRQTRSSDSTALPMPPSRFVWICLSSRLHLISHRAPAA